MESGRNKSSKSNYSNWRTLKITEKIDDKIEKEIIVLGDFINIYCRRNHRIKDKSAFTFKNFDSAVFKKEPLLCEDCTRLLSHGIVMRLKCPYDPKPMCKKCPTHCYKPFYREKIREVMRFSGSYLIKHGRLDLIFHYYF